MMSIPVRLLVYQVLFLPYILCSVWCSLNKINTDYLSQSLQGVFFFTILGILYFYGRFVLTAFSQHHYTVVQVTKMLSPLLVALLLIEPLLSKDVYGYAALAWNYFQYGLNPYVVAPGGLESNPWYSTIKSIYWSKNITPYGPAFILTLAPPSLLSSIKAILFVVIFKVGLLVSLLCGLLYLEKRAGSARSTIVPMLLCNPVVLISGLGEAHNDLLVMALLCFFIGAWKGGNWTFSSLAIAAAALSKLTVAPLLVLGGFRQGRFSIRRASQAALLFGSLTLLLFLPFEFEFQGALNGLLKQGELGCFSTCSPLIAVLNWLAPSFSREVRVPVFSAIFISSFLYFGIRKEHVWLFGFSTMLGVLLVLLSWLTPWYFLLLLPLLPFLELQNYTRHGILLIISAYSFFLYFVF
jgi:hypothetical protein